MFGFVETSIADPGWLSWTLYPNFSIPDPGSKDSGSASASKTLKIVSKLSEIWSRIRIFTHPGSGSATLMETDSIFQASMWLVWSWFRWQWFFTGLRFRMGLEGIKNLTCSSLRFSKIPDPTHVSESIETILWVKILYFLSISSTLFLYLFKKLNNFNILLNIWDTGPSCWAF